MADERPYTAEEKLACARRELSMRERVYPFRVSQAKMTPQQADRETALMRAIVADYEKQAAGERLL
jgi:hypothetical protein